MKISVESGARNRYEAIIELLQNNSIQYCGMDKANPIAMVFEVDIPDEKQAVMMVERLIKSAPFGRSVSFRVVPSGKIVYYK